LRGILNFPARYLTKNTAFTSTINDRTHEDSQILMLVAYPKSVKDNLTDKETAILRNLVKEL
jgi:hypothetical protein